MSLSNLADRFARPVEPVYSFEAFGETIEFIPLRRADEFAALNKEAFEWAQDCEAFLATQDEELFHLMNAIPAVGDRTQIYLMASRLNEQGVPLTDRIRSLAKLYVGAGAVYQQILAGFVASCGLIQEIVMRAVEEKKDLSTTGCEGSCSECAEKSTDAIQTNSSETNEGLATSPSS